MDGKVFLCVSESTIFIQTERLKYLKYCLETNGFLYRHPYFHKFEICVKCQIFVFYDYWFMRCNILFSV